ncbi:hypothetical protein PPYR_02805 [Photinus pyralis]|uniref:RAP domain-containing protein n=1 Tax=Photinus pyralis TaxID=7054 RepID=A0A5N4A100_PHOPY|nr:FAST kinase domain-containing protein 5, mitochondrial isoform X2 [Photinus pyralis]KAB0791005.1 hypothetical protein PPYR_02805 [Photinus pyralis]
MLVSCLKNVSNKFKPVLKLYSQTHVLRTRYKQNNRTFTQIASLHTSSPSLAIYRDTENVYAYNIIQSLPTTKNVPVFSITNSIDNLYDFDNRLNQNWRTKTASEIVDCFKSVLNYCTEHDINLADPRFDKLVDGLMDNIQHLTDSNLCDLFHCLIRLPVCDSYAARNYHDVWSALDDVCCWKLNNWPLETTFVFADYWYRLNLGRVGKYTTHFIERIITSGDILTKSQLVRLFFFINICRRSFNYDFDGAIEQYIGELSVDEMAVIAMGCFKSQRPIHLTYILKQMMETLKAERASAHEITATAVLKVLRYSSSVLLVDQLMDLLDHLVSEVDRLSNTACTHIALLGTTLQFFHEESLQRVAEKVLRDLSNTEAVRVKDIERLLLALTMFHYTPKTERDIFQAILEEVDRPERRLEFMKFPRSLACVLNFLSIKKMYLHELMSKILDREYILELYGKSPKKLPREIFSLDVCIDVECPDYVGNRLDPTYRRKAAKWLVEYTPTLDQFKKLTAADRFVLDVTDAVAKMVNGNHNLHADHILPNFAKSDIIICRDGDRFVTPSGFDAYQLGDLMRPPSKDLTWYAIVPVNWNACIRDTNKPLGLIHMKTRLLKSLGYEPILVIWNEFMPLKAQEKVSYIEDKICK